MDLNKNENGIYYIVNYYPTRYNMPQTHEFLKFKENEDEIIVKKYCDQIVNAILNIKKEFGYDKLALIPVPRSSINKDSTIAINIPYIIKELKYKQLDLTLYYDCTGLIYRDADCHSSHNSVIRPTVEQQFQSMKLDVSKLVQNDVIYILLDDIVTRGCTMSACEKHLLNNGLTKDKIIKLAVAQTIS